MTHHDKEYYRLPKPTYPAVLEEINRQKKRAEALEVAGRHKHDGQKDHKGSR